jgi:hypothetical protein
MPCGAGSWRSHSWGTSSRPGEGGSWTVGMESEAVDRRVVASAQRGPELYWTKVRLQWHGR